MLNKIRSTSYDVEWASARLTTISLISSPTFPDQRQWVLSRYLEVMRQLGSGIVSIFKSNKGFSRAALVPEKQHRIVTSSVDFLKFSHLLRTWLE